MRIPPKEQVTFHDLQIYFAWGLADLDRSKCHKTAWKSCAGDIVWDDNFDLNPYHAQRDLLVQLLQLIFSNSSPPAANEGKAG